MSSAAQLAQNHWNKTPLFISPEERYGLYPWLPKVAEFANHRGHNMLEVGCGTGCDLLQFAENGAFAHGIDITAEHLRLAKERVGSKADVRFGDGRAIPFPNNTFDYVYSHGVIMCSDEPRKFAQEILRVLKPGGRFNIHAYSAISYITFRLWTLHGRQWRRWTEGPDRTDIYVDMYTGNYLRKLFQPAKISLTKQELVIASRTIPRWTGLPQVFGWYLVAKGTKP